MKKSLLFIALCCIVNMNYSQVTAKDCTAAVNVCTNNSFSVSPAGSGFIDFTTSSTISNPVGNPVGVVPPGGSGCLKTGEVNPTWMIINIQTPGTLEFSMGAGTGAGAQTGCYDWIMWPYNASTCAGINANTQAPVRCCWNNHCSGGTGLASAANLPAGGFADDFGAPVNVNCGDKFILCFSNYSSVNTLVPLNFFGTAIVSCSAISNTLAINSPSICSGAIATLSVPSSPGTTYTWQPGGSTSNSFTVSPASTTIYTLTATNACGTLTGTTAVIVSPAINISFANTNGNCISATLGSSTVTATGGIGAYTYQWAPIGGTSNTASGLTSNTYSMTVTDALGCKNTATTSIIAPAPISFSLNTTSGGTVLLCNPNTLTINAVNTSTLSNVTYTWTPGNLNGNSISVSTPGVYTVIGQDLTVGSCSATQTIQITQNTSAPSITITPATRTLTCGSPCASFTAVSTTTTNISGFWTDGSAILAGPSATPLLLCVSAPGTYTVIFTDAVTGCTNSAVASVISNTTVPTMTVNSPNGFTLTCSQPSLGMNINTNSTLAPKQYSWTNVSTNVTTSPANGGYTVTVPGQYIACLSANLCVVCQTITVSQDTVRPLVSGVTNLIPTGSYTLNCYQPTTILTATSNPLLPATSYSWITPPNLTVSQNTINVSMTNITSSTTPTNYTVLAVGANGCVGRQKIQMYKDLYVPPYTAVFTPSAISCANQCVAFSTGPSTSTVPITYTFTSPAPTFTSNVNGALFCNPGTYTMTYQSTLNGCKASTVATVPLNVTPPATVALTTVTINCGAPTATLTAGTTTTSTSYSYTWSGPLNAGMSCPGGVGCYSTTTNMPGYYFVSILNTVNGCRSSNTVNVVGGSLDVQFTPDPSSGFAPLGVSFNNTSPFTSNGGTVTTVWSYGNGISVSTTSLANTYSATGFPDGNTIYQSAGSYTVLLMMTQNSGTSTCMGTATAVVNVELPSDVTVPNVFTPNGDGVNDFFTLLTTNLTDISCTIYDRWGVKMYDVKSEKGNISWDGKNLSGKEAPDGTYFYLLKVTGKDGKDKWTDSKGQDVKLQGTINLYR